MWFPERRVLPTPPARDLGNQIQNLRINSLQYCTNDLHELSASTSTQQSPLQWPYSSITEYPARLYLTCSDPSTDNTFEDECMLILPFPIGGENFARTSDGTRLGEDRDYDTVTSKDTFGRRYQHGHQPFVELHQVRLVNMLRSWLAIIERGDWKIDANGVMDSINEWKKADMEKCCERYVIPANW